MTEMPPVPRWYHVMLALFIGVPLFVGCLPCYCDPVVITSEGEEVVMGNTDPRTDELTTPNPRQPDKGDDVPPINGDASDKLTSEEVRPGNPEELVRLYGTDAKMVTDPLNAGIVAESTKIHPTVIPDFTRSGRLRVTITDQGELRPERLMTIEGDVMQPSMLKGELLAVIYLDGQPFYYETFADPLISIGFPEDREGHSYSQQTEGTLLISIPARLVENTQAVRIDLYRLDPSIAFDTALTPETLPTLIRRSELVGSIEGEALARIARESGQED